MALLFEFKINKVISGGQTGADRAGLEAAKFFGVETGGWAPKNYRTQVGNDPSLKEFNLLEDSSFAYQPRTLKNVKNSDGTLIIGLNLFSPGCALTQQYCARLSKPMQLVQLSSDQTTPFLKDALEETIQWIKINDISVLNIAGNREVLQNGHSLVFTPVYNFTLMLLKSIHEKSI